MTREKTAEQRNEEYAETGFFENLFRAISDGIIVTDAGGAITRINKAVVEMLGYSEEELIGKNASSLSHKHYATATDPAMIERLFKKDLFEKYETAWLRKDGSACPVELNISIVKDKGGEVTGAVGIARDITERRQAETALRESEANLTALVDNTQDLICSVDRESCIITTNKAFRSAFADLFGGRLEKGSCVLDFAPIEQHRDWLDVLGRTLDGEHIIIEQQFRKDDRTVILETSTNPIFSDSGEVMGVTFFIRNITERRQSEEERIRLQTAIEQADESILITDTRGTILYVNPAFIRTSGFTRAESVGRHISFLASERQDRKFYRAMVAKIMAGRMWKGRFLRSRKDGTPFDEEATISPIRNNKGVITNYVALMRDITQETVLEQQLRQAQKMEALGRLAGGIAHDFNNILSAIVGFAEMSLYSCDSCEENSRLKDNLKQVLGAAERGEKLVDQILTFSRRSIGQKRPVRLSSIMEESMKMLRAMLPTTIEIRHVSETNARVLADATQVQQLFMNLCTNAAYAMQEHGGLLELHLRETGLDAAQAKLYGKIRPGAYIQLVVRDTGTGIEPEIIDRIFDPFFTTKETGEGAGMGLATVHGIVKQHDGTINVASTPGSGTTFTVLLPRFDSAETKTDENTEDFPKGNERVLFVDDEKHIVASQAQILESLGYRVTAVRSSREALDVFRSSNSDFDIVVTDQTMPSMDGLHLAAEIRRINSRVPVLLCTGYSDQVTPERARAAGIKTVLRKPVKRKRMAEALRKELDGKSKKT